MSGNETEGHLRLYHEWTCCRARLCGHDIDTGDHLGIWLRERERGREGERERERAREREGEGEREREEGPQLTKQLSPIKRVEFDGLGSTLNCFPPPSPPLPPRLLRLVHYLNDGQREGPRLSATRFCCLATPSPWIQDTDGQLVSPLGRLLRQE